MNAPAIPLNPVASHGDETLIRRMLRGLDKRQAAEVCRLCNWEDESSLNKIINNHQGIKLEALDALLNFFDLSIQQEEYMAYLRKGNTIGANCCRASESLGYCKAR